MTPYHRRKMQLLVILLLVVAGLTGKLFAQTKYSPEVLAKINMVENNLVPALKIEGSKAITIEARMNEYKIPAVSIAVIKDFKVEWVKAYGYADRTLKTKATLQTLFQAASISKSLNGVGALKLVQDKKIDLQTDINSLLKSWKFPYDSLSGNKQITLANLLSHTAGLTVHGFPGYNVKDKLPTVNQVLDGQAPANTALVRSQFAPGLRVVYSGGGTTISQVIIADQAELPYPKYMYDNVLKPMGMTSSFYGAPQTPAQLQLVSTAYHMDGSEVPGKYHIYPEQAAAALWTNPSDLAQYIIETQLAWNGRSAKVLDQSTTKLRLTPVMENAALGVFIIKKPDGTYFSHGGANEGFRCQYYGNVDNGNGVVVMVNSDNGAILNEIVNSVAEVYGWKDFYKQTVKKIASVPDDVLNKYAGKYLMEKDTVLISKKGDHLAVQAPNEPMFEIFPESQTLFFIKEIPIQVEFTDGKMFVLNSGRRTEARKL